MLSISVIRETGDPPVIRGTGDPPVNRKTDDQDPR